MKLICVTVVTPALNKSFKFQSDWPYNNSQVYLLDSIIEDLKTDDKKEFKPNEKGYFFSAKVNYPNNKSLIKQNVYVDNNGKITKTEVVDKDGNTQIIMEFKKQEYNKKFTKDYFELNSLLKTTKKEENNQEKKEITAEENKNPATNPTQEQKPETTTNTEQPKNNTQEQTNTSTTTESETAKKETTENTASIKDVVYPMHLPNNTYLTNQEKISTKTGERLILTFGGDSSFILVEETSKIPEENLVIPTSGVFDFLTDVIGIIDTHSLSWHSNGIDYYMASDVIETSELIDIARSINVLPVSK